MNNTVMNLSMKENLRKLQNAPLNISYFFRSVNFFHGTGDKFDGQEFADFISDVKRCIKHNVPTNGSNKQLRCVFQRSKNRFSKKSACNHSASEYNKHCAEPTRQRMFSANLNLSSFPGKVCVTCMLLLITLRRRVHQRQDLLSLTTLREANAQCRSKETSST